ncbi:MAG: type I-B CRISPR-associated protein Cas7/Csh2 [Halanaerobiaceae bacterium]|jgi:CRISPR-associated protein Csh2|nr:type I-B CRISPR-associated protein Cas7/Csh2 [Halanaerobiaceae bacterium]
MTVIKNRSELLFLYDVTDSNPNGDPIDENKPRIDEETGNNFVTDVRLKRTIRDYLHDYRGEEIFILELRDEDGTLKDKEARLDAFKDNSELLKKCVDVRLFGATTAVKNRIMTLTGPVQFKYGRSLHRVNMTYVKGTTVMPSKESKKQGTFTERYVLPYSLIAFYGIINENAAINQGIDLTEEDIQLLLDGMWNGTKNLISNSKTGQMPRLLLRVIYREKNYHLGELDKRVRFISEKQDEEIRDIEDGKLEVTGLVNALKDNREKILGIEYKLDDRLQIVHDGEKACLKELLSEFGLVEINF